MNTDEKVSVMARLKRSTAMVLIALALGANASFAQEQSAGQNAPEWRRGNRQNHIQNLAGTHF